MKGDTQERIQNAMCKLEDAAQGASNIASTVDAASLESLRDNLSALAEYTASIAAEAYRLIVLTQAD